MFVCEVHVLSLADPARGWRRVGLLRLRSADDYRAVVALLGRHVPAEAACRRWVDRWGSGDRRGIEMVWGHPSGASEDRVIVRLTESRRSSGVVSPGRDGTWRVLAVLERFLYRELS